MIYEDRFEAGTVLAEALKKGKPNRRDLIIAAIARGGIVLGKIISQKIGVPLYPLVIKKIGAPQNPELAIGAIAPFGKPVLDEWLIRDLDISRDYLKKEIIKKRKEAQKREKFLISPIEESALAGKTVIVVDDGVATGASARAAARLLKSLHCKKLILAVGCASTSAYQALSESYDKIICPIIDDQFQAVGQYYRNFSEIDDEEVKAILVQSAKFN